MAHQLRYQVVRGQAKLPDGTAGIVTAPFQVDGQWEGRAGNLPHVEIVGELGAAVAVDLIRLSDSMPGWAVRASFASTGDDLELVALDQRRVPRRAGVVYDFEIGEVVAEVGDAVERRTMSARLLRSLGFGSVLDDAKRLLVDPTVTRHLGDGWGAAPLRPGGAQRSPHHYALWANRYVWALKADPRRPNQHIVDADMAAGIFRTIREVTNQTNRCKPRYLTRSHRKGVPGGELTDESIVLLAELGIKPGSDHPAPHERNKESN